MVKCHSRAVPHTAPIFINQYRHPGGRRLRYYLVNMFLNHRRERKNRDNLRCSGEGRK
jgi:hypothetical protein